MRKYKLLAMKTRLNQTFYCIEYNLCINKIFNKAVDTLATIVAFKVLCYGILKLLGFLVTTEINYLLIII